MDVGAAKTGTGAPEGDRTHGISIWSNHLVTPETETTCHYHFGFARNFQLDDQAMSKLLDEGTIATFLEDKVMLEAQQKNLNGGAIDGLDQHHRRRGTDSGAADARRTGPRRGALTKDNPIEFGVVFGRNSGHRETAR